ncbi:MAG: hypothetical protein KGQ40_14980, partial [Rhodospirillales bacterium]|nr:hypothetical protein [Rhodospirillales bacterium]
AADLILTSPVEAPLVRRGATPLTTVTAAAPGAVMACVSAPSDRIGTVGGVNLGVDVKSVAALLDDRWQRAAAPRAAWAAIARAGMRFENWENCGVKLEGRPSPASILVTRADGSYADDVNDGNPATTFFLVPRRYAADRVAAMLSRAGDLDETEGGEKMRVFLSVFRDGPHTLLVEQGIPLRAATTARKGFIALYVERQAP